MLIEIHMLQNHAPSNLNRDDTGSPKECIFGGVQRGRISSQCLKRSIRRSPVFHEALRLNGSEPPLATRTRQLPDLVKQRLKAMGLPEDLAEVAAQKASGFGTKDAKEREEDGNTAQTMFLTDADVDAIVDVLHQAAQEAKTAKALQKVKGKDLQESKELRNWRPLTLDLALFGRMITSPAFQDVQASLQVAHALSTNKIDHEFDYFTAVDDLQQGQDADDKGADMIGDIEFNSACYYKYFSIDFDGLVDNLVGPRAGVNRPLDQTKAPDATTVTEARALALRGVAALVRAAIFTTPTGKQNTFAAHQLPDVVLIELRAQKTPISYANAFVKPARATGEVDLVADSMHKLVQHVDQLTRKFSLKTAGRLWFSTREQHGPEDQPDAKVTECETIDDLTNGLQQLLEAGGTGHA